MNIIAKEALNLVLLRGVDRMSHMLGFEGDMRGRLASGRITELIKVETVTYAVSAPEVSVELPLDAVYQLLIRFEEAAVTERSGRPRDIK